jgi:hypothetical protein
VSDVEIVRDSISLERLRTMAVEGFSDLVKAVVDVEREVMALADGSRQADIWGIDLYPSDHPDPSWLEFDSMINVRPRLGNPSRSVEDADLRERIVAVVAKLVRP